MSTRAVLSNSVVSSSGAVVRVGVALGNGNVAHDGVVLASAVTSVGAVVSNRAVLSDSAVVSDSAAWRARENGDVGIADVALVENIAGALWAWKGWHTGGGVALAIYGKSTIGDESASRARHIGSVGAGGAEAGAAAVTAKFRMGTAAAAAVAK